jgi:hypothetical protein
LSNNRKWKWQNLLDCFADARNDRDGHTASVRQPKDGMVKEMAREMAREMAKEANAKEANAKEANAKEANAKEGRECGKHDRVGGRRSSRGNGALVADLLQGRYELYPEFFQPEI